MMLSTKVMKLSDEMSERKISCPFTLKGKALKEYAKNFYGTVRKQIDDGIKKAGVKDSGRYQCGWDDENEEFIVLKLR